MNKKTIFVFGGYLILLLVLISILGYNCPHRQGAIITGDPVHGYAPLIESEEVSDWHCALFLHECIILRKVVFYLTGHLISGIEVLKLLWYVATLCIILAFLYGTRKAITLGDAYISVPYVLSLLLLFNFKSLILFLCIDYFFIALLLIGICISLSICERHSKVLQWILVILLLLILLHLGQYRRNAAVLLPILIVIAIHGIYPQLRKTKLYMISFIGSIVLYYGGHSLTRAILPTRYTHPTVMMLTSDLMVAAGLRGETQTEKEIIYRTSGIEVIHKGELFSAGVPVEWNLSYSDENWQAYMQHYWESWKKHPSSMIGARILQFTQFFSYGKSHPIVVKAIESIFPQSLNKISNTSDKLRKIEIFTASARLIFYGAAIAILMYSFRKKRSLTNKHLPPIYIMLIIMALLYLSSYILITPTGDDRYHAPSIILLCWAFALFLAQNIQRRLNRGKTDCRLTQSNEF